MSIPKRHHDQSIGHTLVKLSKTASTTTPTTSATRNAVVSASLVAIPTKKLRRKAEKGRKATAEAMEHLISGEWPIRGWIGGVVSFLGKETVES